MTKGSVVGLVIFGGVVLLVGAALTPPTTSATNVPALGYAELPNGRGGANVEAIVKNGVRFSLCSARAPYASPMLAPAAKTKRFLEMIQLVLSFASVCAVVDSTFIDVLPRNPTGYYTRGAPQGEARGDRLFGDLARAERKRREAEVREALKQR